MYNRTSINGRILDTNINTSPQNGNISFGNVKLSSTPISSVWNRKNNTDNNSLPKTPPKGSIWNRHRKYSLSNTSLTSPNTNGSFDNSQNHTMYQTGPLLASTRYNIDIGTLTDTKSPGLTTRIVQYSSQDTESNKQRVTHQPKYGSPGQFPNVQLNKSPLPQIRPLRKTVTVRIAPPDTSYSPVDRTLIFNESSMMYSPERKSDNLQTEISTRSVLDALKEISRKRIHAREEDTEVNKRLKSTTSLDNETCTRSKRNRDSESPTFSNSGVSPITKKYRSNIKDIIMSHSSSVGMLQNKYMMKRKADVVQPVNINKLPKLNSHHEFNSQNGILNQDVSAKQTSSDLQEKSSNSQKQMRSFHKLSGINQRTRNHYRFNPEIFEKNRVELPFKEVSNDNRLLTLLGVLDGLDKETIHKKIKEISKSKKNQTVVDGNTEMKPLVGILSPPGSKSDSVKKKVTFNLPEANDSFQNDEHIQLSNTVNVSKESLTEKHFTAANTNLTESNSTLPLENNNINDLNKSNSSILDSATTSTTQNSSVTNINNQNFQLTSIQTAANVHAANVSVFTSPSQTCNVTFGNTSPIVSCGSTFNTVPSVSSSITKCTEAHSPPSFILSTVTTSIQPQFSFGIKPINSTAVTNEVTNFDSQKSASMFNFETKMTSFNSTQTAASAIVQTTAPALHTETPRSQIEVTNQISASTNQTVVPTIQIATSSQNLALSSQTASPIQTTISIGQPVSLPSLNSGAHNEFKVNTSKTESCIVSDQIKTPFFNFNNTPVKVLGVNSENKPVSINNTTQSPTGGFIFHLKTTDASVSKSVFNIGSKSESPPSLFEFKLAQNKISEGPTVSDATNEKSSNIVSNFTVSKPQTALPNFGATLNKNSNNTLTFAAFNPELKTSDNVPSFDTSSNKQNNTVLNNNITSKSENIPMFGMPVSTTANLQFGSVVTTNNSNIPFGTPTNASSNNLPFGISTTNVNSNFNTTSTKSDSAIFGSTIKKDTEQSQPVFTFGNTKNSSFNNAGAQNQSVFGDATKPTFALPFGTAAFNTNTTSSATTSITQNTPSFGGFGSVNPATNAEKLPFGTSTVTSSSDSKLFTFGNSTNSNTANFGVTTTGSFGNTAKNAFGSTNAAPIFGSTPQTTTSQSTFGVQTTTANVFGSQPNTHVFGGNPTNKTNIFGSTPAFTGENQTPNLFGSTQQPAGFGSAVNQTNTLFGSSATQPNIFGTTSTQSNVTGFGTNNNTFGSTTTPQSNIFGSTTQQPSTVFGTVNTTTSPFNSTAQLPTFGSPNNVAFGSTNQASSGFGNFPTAVTSNQASSSVSSGVFTFGGSSQSSTTATTKPSAFQFGANSTSSTPSNFNFSAGQSTAPPAFGASNMFGSGSTSTFGTASVPQFAPPSGSGGAMFSIGSGSTAPRPRSIARARRQK